MRKERRGKGMWVGCGMTGSEGKEGGGRGGGDNWVAEGFHP
jgi:hypothetical protein